MTGYHDHTDFDYLSAVKKGAPEEFKAWAQLDGVVGREDGEIPRKYRELIALAVANTTQCVYCLDAHTKNAVDAGASQAEVAEATMVAAALRAGAAASHSALTMKLFEQHSGNAES